MGDQIGRFADALASERLPSLLALEVAPSD
jgi:hypothetical protein